MKSLAGLLEHVSKKAVLPVVALSGLLLVIFLAAFFWLDQFTQLLAGAQLATIAENGDIILGTVSGFQIAVSKPALRVFLGGGTVFFEFIIIVLSMLDRVVDTLKTLIRPILVLIPLAAFVNSAYQTFDPVVKSILPSEITGASADFVATVNQADFTQNVFFTLGTMLLYLLFRRILGTPDSGEVRALRAELRRLKRRSG